ncbi:hypothetical protein ABIB94_007087 [Bradyrhizobium sp. JR7.2]|uniref:hypothetical protein n=1 Tax=Bradyrhizobium sp. JR7.2 TaxID=3156375 RepID=UPI003393A78D
MARVRIPPIDVPAIDLKTGEFVIDWYDAIKALEKLGLFDLAATTTTVSGLPAATTNGSRYFVTDATATTFNSIVAGGGSNKVPVFADGTNWRIG